MEESEVNPDFSLSFFSYYSLFSSSVRAHKVLNSAKDLVQSLDEADNAQKKAKAAIEQANDDIASARADLEEVNRAHFNRDARRSSNSFITKILIVFDLFLI